MGLTAAIGFGIEQSKKGAEIAGGVIKPGVNKAVASTSSAFKNVGSSISGAAQVVSGVKSVFSKANNLVSDKTKNWRKQTSTEGFKGSFNSLKNLCGHNKSSSKFSNKKGE